MKKKIFLVLRILLWGALALLGLFVIQIAFLSLRYSPGYMVNEVFRDMGTPYDFRFLPERKLAASPEMDWHRLPVRTGAAMINPKKCLCKAVLPAGLHFL